MDLSSLAIIGTVIGVISGTITLLLHVLRGYRHFRGRARHAAQAGALETSPGSTISSFAAPVTTPAIRTPDQRLRVFVSSTLQELAQERATARQAIRRLRLSPILFELGARPHPPRDLYRAYLGQSDVFLGIYWQKYGWVAPSEDVSGLEDEYRLAADKPKLIYIKTPAPEREPRLGELLDQIRADDHVSYKSFKTAAELRNLIVDDLALLLTERFANRATEPTEKDAPASSTQPGSRTRTNLPLQTTSFIGRERELDQIKGRVDASRLLTLTGPGGVGKTRLALQTAADLLNDYADGAWLVELAPLPSPELVPPAVARAVGVREVPGRQVVETLSGGLRAKQLLLVLDNCEHVLGACAELANDLLRTCAGLTILATSREPLRIPGEKIWPVLPLPMPDGHRQYQADELADYPAVRLFMERAQAVQPAFVLTPENTAAVVRICSRLDGLPLAIELAAARIAMLSPEEIDARLEDRFRLLVGGSRTAAPRQQTLKAAVGWSYEMLSAAEQRLFDRLSVFAGTFSLEAVESVCSGDEVVDPVDGLASLVDRSLVQVEPPASGADTRYRLLESVRTYGWERLLASDEAERVRRGQANWLATMAERACAAFHGPEQGDWLRWAENEHANVQIVLQWLIEHQDGDTGLRIVAALWWSWLNHEHWSECQDWCTQVLALPGALARSRSRARTLVGAGALAAISGGDPTLGRQWLEEGLSIGLEVDDPGTIIRARLLLSMLIGLRGEADLEQLQATASDIVAYARRVGNAWGENRALDASAQIALKQGNIPFGVARLEEAVRVARAASDAWSLGMSLLSLGDLERSRGEHARAGVLYEETVATLSRIGLVEQVFDNPHLLHNLGYVALAAGQPDLARERFTGALALFQRREDRRGQAESLIGIGAVSAAAGRGDMAARFFGAAESVLEVANIQLWQSNRNDYEHWLGIARNMLESDAFEREWSVGRSMSIEEAVALALTG